MKNEVRNILILLAGALMGCYLTVYADEPATTDILAHSAEYQSHRSAGGLLQLDAQALGELAEMGMNMEDDSSELAEHIIEYAANYLGRPYRAGGKGPSVFDCSGFTSYVFGQHGISLSASSSAQYLQGEKLTLEEVQPGDLLFFSGSRGGRTVGHVALAVEVDNGKIRFIHAARTGGIRYDTYPDGGYYSQRYLGARRVIE